MTDSTYTALKRPGDKETDDKLYAHLVKEQQDYIYQEETGMWTLNDGSIFIKIFSMLVASLIIAYNPGQNICDTLQVF